MDLRDLSDDELAQLAAFALGVCAGLILLGLVTVLIEEWVIAADAADRRRIKEILREMLDPGRIFYEEQKSAGENSAGEPPPGRIRELPYPETTPH